MHDWFAGHQFLHIPLERWAWAALVAVGGFVLVRGALQLLAVRLGTLAERRGGTILPMAAAASKATSSWLILLLFVLIGLHLLNPSVHAARWLDSLIFLTVGLQLGLWLDRAIVMWASERLGETGERRGNPVVMSMLSWFARVVVWALLLLAVLGNVGVNVTAFIASLGIGGIALAFGLQNILKDLFASLAIGLDKPFEIGDFIQFGDQLGTVLYVGIKTTRIKSLSGEELCIGNANLLENILRNYDRMSTRRIVFNFGLPMDTPRDKVGQVVEVVREIVLAQPQAVLDRAHFKGFGASSFDFEVVYIVQDAGYGVYMDIQQAINMELMARLDALDLRFAVPVSGLRVDGVVHTRKLAEATSPDA